MEFAFTLSYIPPAPNFEGHDTVTDFTCQQQLSYMAHFHVFSFNMDGFMTQGPR